LPSVDEPREDRVRMLAITFALVLAGGETHDAGKSFISEHPRAIVGAVGGAVVGFVVGAGAVIGAGYVCAKNDASCFGSQDAPMLGALFVAPIGGAALASFGGVLGGVTGAFLDDDPN
jgi:hypothetical protein